MPQAATIFSSVIGIAVLNRLEMGHTKNVGCGDNKCRHAHDLFLKSRESTFANRDRNTFRESIEFSSAPSRGAQFGKP